MDVVLEKGAIAAPENQEAQGRSRALYIASVALFPIFISGLFFLIVLPFAIPDSLVGHDTKYASIKSPARGKISSATYQASGQIKELPTGTTAFLMEKKESLYWPKRQLGGPNTQWEGISRANTKSGFQYNLVIVAIGAEGLEQIKEWKTKSNKTGKYPGIPVVKGLKELASLRIIRE